MNEKLKSTVDYMANGIKHACKYFKNRTAGSTSEKKCQEHFGRELKRWADHVDSEPFQLHPKAFMGWMPVASTLSILSVAFFWIRSFTGSVTLSILSVATVLLSVLLFLLEFLFYREFIDFLFPKATSRNIMARRVPKGEIKQRIIFGGHADAAYEMNYSIRGKKHLIAPILIGSIIGMTIIFLSNSLIAICKPEELVQRAIGFVELAFVPFFVGVMFFTNWKCVVDGANDNLSGCYVAMGVLRELSKNNMRLEHTEVCCLITGAEESGLRGSLSYAQRHAKELKQAETIFIALDTLREIKQLKAYTIGQTGTQRNSEEVGDLLSKAGKQCGVQIERAKVFPGATDAEGFSRNGLLACGFCGVDHDLKPYYHTRRDTADNISRDCLETSLSICLELSMLYDRIGGIRNAGQMKA